MSFIANRSSFNIALSAMLIVLLAGFSPLSRAEDSSREYQVKAACIYNFIQFVTWPTSSFENQESPFIIGVVGEDPFHGSLERVTQGNTVKGRPIVVRHFASANDIEPCHVLFIAATQDDSLSSIFRRIGKDPVLTVGETDAFLPSGGCIRFLTEDGKLRFELSPDATDSANLRVSSNLMRLSRIYKR